MFFNKILLRSFCFYPLTTSPLLLFPVAKQPPSKKPKGEGGPFKFPILFVKGEASKKKLSPFPPFPQRGKAFFYKGGSSKGTGKGGQLFFTRPFF